MARVRRGMPAFVAATGVVPGYTRTAGAYRRSLPKSIEKKFFDSDITNSANVQSGVIFNSFNLIPQGTTDQTRIGNKITVRNINVRAISAVDDAGTGALGGGYLRVIIYVDKQCNGVAATVTDILKSAAINSFRNMDQVDRFLILKDKMIKVTVDSANALHTATSTTFWKASWKGALPIHYSSTTGAITELRSNNIGMIYISDNPALNAAGTGIARIKFTDD